MKLKTIADNTLAYFPRKYANGGVLFYLISLVACSLLYFNHALPFYILAMSIFSVLLFFGGSNWIGRQWSVLREGTFVRKVFWTAFGIRIGYALFIWFMNKIQYGTFCESNPGDIFWYVPTALQAAIDYDGNYFEIISNWRLYCSSIADAGYQMYLTLLFVLQGASDAYVGPGEDYLVAAEPYLFVPMILKAVYGGMTCLFMYRIAQRHFGENVARMTAIFCMLQANMIWWCGSFMKETEMVFLACWFVERMDKIILGLDIRPLYISVTVMISLLIFTFRSALFMTSIAATMLALVMTQSRKLSMGKKVLAGAMLTIVLAMAVGDNVVQEVSSTIAIVQDSDYQKRNMEWRTDRGGTGNKFAKYAGAVVFAPLIFTIPFPNMVYTTQDQEMLMQVNGGNFEKNVLSFFVIFAMSYLLLSGQWRQHVFPIAYYVGYLAALVLSVFAQSGRFHMPIIPFAMMFGAYGLTLVMNSKFKQWFTYALVIEVIVCVAWSWFKLAGRGLV